jgi:flagellar protein FliS
MNSQILRDRYVGDSIATASPEKLLTLLYERLVLDLVNAERALGAGDPASATAHLSHAQDIVLELRASLRVEAWEGGPGLASLYAYLITELIGASVAKDVDRVIACRRVVEPLAAAWTEAATAVLAARPITTGPSGIRATA